MSETGGSFVNSIVWVVVEAPSEAFLGASVTSTATLTFEPRPGGPSEPPGPEQGGSVTFEVFVLPRGSPPPPHFGGDPVFTSKPHPVVVDSVTRRAVVHSEPFEPTELGDHHWRVTYVPDPASGWPDTIATGARTAVDKMAASIEARPTIASRLGQFIVDTVRLTGLRGAPPPSGSVSFQVIPPDGPAQMTDANVPLSPTERPTARSRPFRPTKPGRYHWSFVYSGDDNYVGIGAHGGTSVVSTHVPEETMSVAEVGTPVRHERDATFRGRVTYAEVVELLSLPGEVTDD